MRRATGPWAVATLFAGLAALLFRDYGTTWDEGVQATYGELVLRHYTSLGRDRSASTFLDLRFYGPLFETVTAALARLAPAATWDIRHLCTALTGALTVAATGLFAARIDRRLGWLAPLALVTLPRFFGHAFDDSKDIPFACAFAWSMLGCAWLSSARRLRPGLLVACGALIGAALAIRVSGVVLLGFVLLTLVLRRRSVLPPLAAVAVVAWLVMVAAWPWAQEAPLRHPLEALAMSARFSAAYPVLFEGATVLSTELPRRYVPEFLALTVPVAHLLLALLALVLPLRRLSVLLRAWLLLPVLMAVLLKPNVYDGVRHFAFVLPAIAILAAAAALRLADRLRVPAAATALVFLLPVPSMVRLHPYQSTYFNAIAGGVGPASQRYETDYWAASYREAMEAVNARARPGATVVVAANSYSIVCAAPHARADLKLIPTFERHIPGRLPDDVDYYVATTRYGMDRNFPDAPVVQTVGRDGAVFTVVKGR